LEAELEEAEEQLAKTRRYKGELLDTQLEIVRLNAAVKTSEGTGEDAVRQVRSNCICMNDFVLILFTILQVQQMQSELCDAQLAMLGHAKELKELKRSKKEAQQKCDKATEELLAAQAVSNERDVLAKEVEALKESHEDSEAVASYADSMKEIFESKLKEMSQELLTAQYSALRLRKENAEARDSATNLAQLEQVCLLTSQSVQLRVNYQHRQAV
jgi:hypothetical protein